MAKPFRRRSSSSKSDFTEKEMKELRTAFELCDRDQDGKVNSGDFKTMLKNLGIQLEDETIKELIVSASPSGNELIDEDDFMKWIKQLQSLKPDLGGSAEDLVAAFKVFDLNNDGYITREELKKAMDTIGEAVTENQLTEFITLADKDKDGRINYEEFAKLLA